MFVCVLTNPVVTNTSAAQYPNVGVIELSEHIQWLYEPGELNDLVAGFPDPSSDVYVITLPFKVAFVLPIARSKSVWLIT